MQMLGSTCGFLSYFWPTVTQCMKSLRMSQARKVLFAFKKVRLGVKVSC